MLHGWERQQRGGRRLRPRTIKARIALIRRLTEFTNEYLWNWTAGHVDEWMTHLISALDKAESTIRSYQTTLRQFCDFLTDPNYAWGQECQARFGTHPVQICHEWNTAAHLVEDGADPKFVQVQAGYENQSTTAIYTGVSEDFMNGSGRYFVTDTASLPRFAISCVR